MTKNTRLCEDQAMCINDLKETAEIAHLNLGEKELARLYPAFEEMLSLLDSMQGADGTAESALRGAFGNIRTVDSVFFESGNNIPIDNSNNNPSNNQNEVILNNAGERDGRFLVVPNVL